jgi:hypothetical protein
MTEDIYAGLPASVRKALEDVEGLSEQAVPFQNDQDDTDNQWRMKYLVPGITPFKIRHGVPGREGYEEFQAYVNFKHVRLTQASATWRKDRDDKSKKNFALDFQFRTFGEEIGILLPQGEGVEPKRVPVTPYRMDLPHEIWKLWRVGPDGQVRPHSIKAQCLSANIEQGDKLRSFLLAQPNATYQEDIISTDADGKPRLNAQGEMPEPWLWRINFPLPASGLWSERGVPLAGFETTDRETWERDQRARNPKKNFPAHNADQEPFYNFYRGVMHTAKCLVEVATTGTEAQREAMRRGGALYSLTGRRIWGANNANFGPKDVTVPVVHFKVSGEDGAEQLLSFNLRQQGTVKPMTIEEQEARRFQRETLTAEMAAKKAASTPDEVKAKTAALTGIAIAGHDPNGLE